MHTLTDYWFTLEPYVHVGLTHRCVLLYNTLDRATIESEQTEVIDLLRELLQKETNGVVLLTGLRYQNETIQTFIKELRDKYMGDIIDAGLSKRKPVQVLPYSNWLHTNKQEIYKKHNFSRENTKVFENLCKICLHVDAATPTARLIPFLQSLPEGITFNIIGKIDDVPHFQELLSFFDQYPSPKKLVCSYAKATPLPPTFEHNFSYALTVDFPVDKEKWNHSRRLLLGQPLPVEYVFEVTSLEDCRQAEQLIEEFQIEKYQWKPRYTGENTRFFEENVFLTKEDILETPLSIKDIITRQAINLYDFGKIDILPDGKAYANLNHPALGNIYTDSLYEIVSKEIENGTSWFRIRNQAPCNACVYQWLCPSPSDYEIIMGRPDLCHMNNEKKQLPLEQSKLK